MKINLSIKAIHIAIRQGIPKSPLCHPSIYSISQQYARCISHSFGVYRMKVIKTATNPLFNFSFISAPITFTIAASTLALIAHIPSDTYKKKLKSCHIKLETTAICAHHKKKFLILEVFLFIGWWCLVTFKLFLLHIIQCMCVCIWTICLSTFFFSHCIAPHRHHHHHKEGNCDCAYVEAMMALCM